LFLNNTVVTNPILPGFNPDPSILRVGDDYYIATSTFEWFPGVQIHHSRDLVNWHLMTRPLTRISQLDLRGVGNSMGVWAPCLSYHEGTFYLIYTDVKTMIPGPMDCHNYVVTAPAIDGPWSEPTYLHSLGFDPSLFHDRDGRQWLLAMTTEHRPGRPDFGGIILQEYDRTARKLVGPMTNIFGGRLGATEGPHLYWRDGWYYLVVAEGGTGSGHAINVARSRTLTGPYEADPAGLMLTSRFAPDHPLQCAGHGSFVEAQDGSWWCAHLCTRSNLGLPAAARLGRETALQPMHWSADGWPRLSAPNNRPLVTTAVPDLPPQPWPQKPARDDFDGPLLSDDWQSLRVPITPDWADLGARPGWLRLRGRDSLRSLFEQSLLARRLEHRTATITTCIDANPDHPKRMAGLVFIYDVRTWSFLHLRGDEAYGSELVLTHCRGGALRQELAWAHPRQVFPLTWMRLEIGATETRFLMSHDGESWNQVGAPFPAAEISSAGFTGPFVGLSCQDGVNRSWCADFDWFSYSGADLPTV
jgi:xylan 1,4-beta-xylosidase